MDTTSLKAQSTRAEWMAVLDRFHEDRSEPASPHYWSAQDTISRDEIRATQDAKIAAVTPFLYENSGFYRRRFDRLGLLPTDIRTVDDLVAKWPVVDKSEMMEDAAAHPPYGTYTTVDEAVWADRGWMLFSSSGSTGIPRVFRYTHFDRKFWEQANARALHSNDFRKGDTVFPMVGFGPHVWAWGAQYALAKMGLPVIPGGGMDGRARANVIARYNPTILLCTPSYALYLGRVLQEMGVDPKDTAVRSMFCAGEPAMGIAASRERIQDLWGARIVEFYGCTEASPHCGGFSCPESQTGPEVTAHLLEDIQVWEVVDPETKASLPKGQRGLTVCTNLNTESSPQLRFLVGDYTVLDDSRCGCGRTHVRALGCFTGRADDLINLRGVKFMPSQIEEIVRAVPGIGDEFQLLLQTQDDGLDTMTVRVEHGDPAMADRVRATIAKDIRTRCEVRADVEILDPGSLPKTEFKAARVKDQRVKA